MKTKKLADWLGVSDSTIRLWAREEFAPYLTPAAQGDGTARNFSEYDARVLALVALRREQGHPLEEIHVELKRLQAEDWTDLPEMPPAPPEAGPIALMPREAADTALTTQRVALMREIVILQDRVETLEDQLEAERQRSHEELAAERARTRSEIDKRDALQADLAGSREQLGELRGRLETLAGQNEALETARAAERRLLVRGLIAVAVVAGLLLVVVILLALANGALVG